MKETELKKPLWIPYLIAILGILITLPIWYLLEKSKDPSIQFFDRLVVSLPWLVLVSGILLSLLLGLFLRFLQVTSERKQALAEVSAEYEKEIAERIQTEETKQKLERALLQGQKLQAIGTLAGGIAHDFNNLLYAVTGYVEMAREDVPVGSLIHTNLGKVLEASHRGQDLIARILAFSRRHHHEVSPLNLYKTIEGVLALLKPTIPAGVHLDVKNKLPKEAFILGNETQLHQVIVNIINNAVDAMDDEGVVTLKVSHVNAKDDYLKQFPKIKNSDYCKLEISDTGHGMDQPTLERIFEPFFTTKEVGKGTGLGLSTVHAIVTEHEGEILVDSQLGRGTTFTILLPELNDKEISNGKDTVSRR